MPGQEVLVASLQAKSLRHDHVIGVPVGSVKLGVSKRECCLDHKREGFMFDAEQRMECEFQGQDMRVMQFEMYREVTVFKMDIYLIGNTLKLSFCITLFTEGRSGFGFSGPWVVWLWSTTLIGGSRTSR